MRHSLRHPILLGHIPFTTYLVTRNILEDLRQFCLCLVLWQPGSLVVVDIFLPPKRFSPSSAFSPPPPKTSRSDATHHIVTHFSPRDLLWLSTSTSKSSSASPPSSSSSSTSSLSITFHPFPSIIPRHSIRNVSFDLLHIINNRSIT